MFEIEVISNGQNIARGKSATQTSNFKDKKTFGALKAIDGQMNSFSHTNRDDECAWWMVDLGSSVEVESVKIHNRYCREESESDRCLCRLSFAAVSLLDDRGKWVDATMTGDTCGVLVWEHSFAPSADFCL